MEASRLPSPERTFIDLANDPRMKGIDWTLLRSFLAVVEKGSLSAAAASIGTTGRAA